MDLLLRSLPNGADGEALFFDSIRALVALSHTFLDRDTGCLIPVRSSLDERDVQIEAHLIDMIPCLVVVKSVDDEVELVEEAEAKPVLLYFPDEVFDLDCAILSANRLLQCLTLRHVDMVSSEQELSVEVADVDRIEVDH